MAVTGNFAAYNQTTIIMTKKLFSLLVCFGIVLAGMAQQLQNFTVNISAEKGGNNYLSITDKKAYSASEAKSHKETIDFALIRSDNYGSPVLEWYNMSGKDEKIPAELRGTATVINGISFDKDQFDKCNTAADLKRMAGHVSNNSFSHFASVGEKEVRYRCFIFLRENGKRGLIWIDSQASGFKMTVKAE